MRKMLPRLSILATVALLLSQASGMALITEAAEAQAPANKELTQAIEQGDKLCKQFKYKEAEPLYSQVLKSNPKNVSALLGLSRAYRHQGKFNKSHSLIEAATDIEPTNALCYIERAKLLQAVGRSSKAIQALQKAVLLAPNNSEVYFYLGWYQELNREKGAEQNLRKAIALKPTNDEAWRILAHALWRQKRKSEALRCMQKAINLAPKTTEYQQELASFLLQDNKLKEAAAVYNGMKKTFPKGVAAYLGLAEIAAQQENTKEQGDLLRQATVIKPTSEEAWLKLAQFYCYEKKFDESLRCARIALGFNPKDSFNNRAVANVMIAADRPKEAESYLEKSVQFANNQQNKLRSQCMLVHLYFVNNKNERAMELAKKMYKASPSEFYAISAMAGALMRFKQYDEGFALLKKGKLLFPKGFDGFDFEEDYLSGLVYAGRYEQAKTLAKQMLVKTPNNSQIWQCLMEVARKTNNKKEAEVAMKHLNGLKLTDYEAMEAGFGGISAGAGESALPLLKQAVETNPDSVDLIMNTRDPKTEKKLLNTKEKEKTRQQR